MCYAHIICDMSYTCAQLFCQLFCCNSQAELHLMCNFVFSFNSSLSSAVRFSHDLALNLKIKTKRAHCQLCDDSEPV